MSRRVIARRGEAGPRFADHAIVVLLQSVVIITRLPFVNLFGELCALIAPEFFEAGPALMEAVVREIDQWPPPIPGQIVHLPLIGVLFQVRGREADRQSRNAFFLLFRIF